MESRGGEAALRRFGRGTKPPVCGARRGSRPPGAPRAPPHSGAVRARRDCAARIRRCCRARACLRARSTPGRARRGTASAPRRRRRLLGRRPPHARARRAGRAAPRDSSTNAEGWRRGRAPPSRSAPSLRRPTRRRTRGRAAPRCADRGAVHASVPVGRPRRGPPAAVSRARARGLGGASLRWSRRGGSSSRAVRTREPGVSTARTRRVS